MKVYNIGKYMQIAQKGNITCTCKWYTIHPDNYLKGEQVCRHIKKVMKIRKIIILK